MGVRSPLSALAVALLALGSGCLTADKKSESKKPDVTQPGVLPPPQAMARPVSGDNPAGPVIPASATAPAEGPVGAAPAATGVGPSFSKLTAKLERKVVAAEMAVGWKNRIAYLPDPVRHGQMSPGLAGQMFLFGAQPKMEFVLADGTLTIDLLDETPRPPGQPAAKAERWQFDKETLRKLVTRDETFGKSYVLFLPWPTYKSDITRVRISARYDPDNGHTLYSTPAIITLDPANEFGAPVFSPVSSGTGSAPMGNRPQSLGSSSVTGLGGFPAAGAQPSGMMPQPGAMMPIQNQPAPMMPIQNGVAPMPIQNGVQPMIPLPSGAIPIQPNGASGAMPGVAPNPAVPEGALPLTITLPGRQ